MSQFLTTIEAAIAEIAPTHSADPAILTAQVMAVVTPQINGLQDSMTLATSDLAGAKSDIADLQKAMNEIVEALNKDDPQSAKVIAQQAVPAAPVNDTAAADPAATTT